MQEEDIEKEGLLTKDTSHPEHPAEPSQNRPKRFPPWALILGTFFLISSILLNIFLLAFYYVNLSDKTPNRIAHSGVSRSASLIPNAVEVPILHDTLYSHVPNMNITLRDKLWTSLNFDRGMVALDEEEVVRMGVQEEPARTLPWDPSKRVFLLNAFHQLHCLKGLYITLTNAFRGGSVDRYEHWVHCLDALRQDVMCDADDELLFVRQDHSKLIGNGHIRQCKDFSKLENWADEHYSCYTFDRFEDQPDDSLHWRNCPKDSPYFQAMKHFFGYDDDWEPDYEVFDGPTFPDMSEEITLRWDTS